MKQAVPPKEQAGPKEPTGLSPRLTSDDIHIARNDPNSPTVSKGVLLTCRILFVISLVVGIVTFHWAAFGCHTFDYATPTHSFTVGYWSLAHNYGRSSTGCMGFRLDASQLDSVWKLGRLVSVLGAALLWTTVTALLVATVWRCASRRHTDGSRSPLVWYTLATSCLCVAVHSALLLVGLGSRTNGSLTMAYGASLALVATVAWLVSALLVFSGCVVVMERDASDKSSFQPRSTTKSHSPLDTRVGRTSRDTRSASGPSRHPAVTSVTSRAVVEPAPSAVPEPVVSPRAPATTAVMETAPSAALEPVVSVRVAPPVIEAPTMTAAVLPTTVPALSAVPRVPYSEHASVETLGTDQAVVSGTKTARIVAPPVVVHREVPSGTAAPADHSRATRGTFYWFPYGLSYIAPAACTVLGLVFFHVAAFGCRTFKIKALGLLLGDDDYSIGYWRVQDPTGNGCIDYGTYDSSDLPAAWRVGRAVGVMGALMSWILLGVVGLASAYSYPRPLLMARLLGVGMVTMVPASLLLLIGKATKDGKYFTLAGGGVLAILGSILWLGGGIAALALMKERPVSPLPRATVSNETIPDDGTGTRNPTFVLPNSESNDSTRYPIAERQAAVGNASPNNNDAPTNIWAYLRENTYMFPYGLRYIAPAACTVLGLIFFHVAAFGCSTFKTDFSAADFGVETTISTTLDDAFAAQDDLFNVQDDFFNQRNDDYANLGLRSTTVGYWKFESPYGGDCLSYKSFKSELEGEWRFGRFVGVFGSLLIWFIFALVTMASAIKFPRPNLVFRIMGGCMGGLSVLSLLLLVGLSSDDGDYLKVAGGGVLAIFSCFLWLGDAVAVVFFMSERARVNRQAASTSPTSPTTQQQNTYMSLNQESEHVQAVVPLEETLAHDSTETDFGVAGDELNYTETSAQHDQ